MTVQNVLSMASHFRQQVEPPTRPPSLLVCQFDGARDPRAHSSEVLSSSICSSLAFTPRPPPP